MNIFQAQYRDPVTGKIVVTYNGPSISVAFRSAESYRRAGYTNATTIAKGSD